ncbi:MAG: hypothetical protein AUG48_06720 [Actinobacteria bacterium 13_1_20CM_3_68_9]|nr:MAG: hypothetical protein AUG48_06720 [Actinobacteria bacterium 13_1_20CM_3_68_9]
MSNPASARARTLIAVAIVPVALATAAPASAGTYRAAICNPDLGARHPDATFERSSRHYRSDASCEVGGDGLVVSHDAHTSGAGTWAAWVVRSPDGTAISRLSVSAAGRAGGGNVPELLGGTVASLTPFAAPAGHLERFRWSGAGANAFAARLRCRRRSGCGPGRGARIRIKRVAVALDDRVSPRLRLDGSLFATGSRRGVQALAPSATDSGGGVRRLLAQVNGQPVTARMTSCHIVDRIATRLRPCPRAAGASFAAATASPPFRQGPNLVRVCAVDYAATTAANRACAQRRVRTDNLCPVSGVAGGATLGARLRRKRGRAIVGGRLLDGNRKGVAGGRVCVATRVRMDGIAERIAVAPLTDADGRFRAWLPPGPSRTIRVAYWPSTATALERYLRLNVPAQPRLRLRPAHPIENGSRVRFRVRLPGPASERRRVRVQARAGRRWLDLRMGLTGAGGIYRARYRFHATTGRRNYRFRAVVPSQAGYPYEAGKSKVKRITVLGRQ